MRKRIWIVNYYTGTPENASNPRYLQFSHFFQQAGYDVITFNASYRPGAPTELMEGDGKFEEHRYGEHRFIHVKVSHYVGNGIKRMWSIFKFAWDIFKNAKRFEKPDVILHNVHTPFDYPIVWAAKKIKAKYIAEAWDIWPDVFAQLGLVSRNNPILKIAYKIEKSLYYHADQLVFTLPGHKQYIENKGWTTDRGGKIDLSRVHYINNGVDIEQFNKDKDSYPRQDKDLKLDGIFKIMYMGSVNYANHVQTLIDAAALLQEDKRYQFFIYGDGAHRDVLEKYVQEKAIKNVHFKEKRIPLCEVAWVVSQATVNIMTYEKGFGYMGVSSGKMFQYLAAGKPIVCNTNIAYDNVIEDNNIGVARDIDKANVLAAEIRKIAELPKEDYISMCNRVREVAERFDYKKLAADEIKVVEAALAS